MNLLRYYLLGAVVIAVGLIGSHVLFRTHALTPTASVQAESGKLSGNANVVADAKASGGSAAKFNSPSSSGTLIFDDEFDGAANSAPSSVTSC